MREEPTMFYFGPWDEPGHFMFHEGGAKVSREERREVPWPLEQLDGGLQEKGHQREGEAVLHHKDGWTAMTFWDRSVDTRPGSHSTYLAKGDFTFVPMLAMANIRFLSRWLKMKFDVRLAQKR